MPDNAYPPVLTFDPTGTVTFAPSGREFVVNCTLESNDDARTVIETTPQGEFAGAPYWSNVIAIRHPLDARATMVVGFGIIFANRYGMTLFFYDTAMIADPAARLEIYRMQQERGGTIQIAAARGMIGYAPSWAEQAAALVPVPAADTASVEKLLEILAAVPEPIGSSVDEAMALLKAGFAAGAHERNLSARFVGGEYGDAA